MFSLNCASINVCVNNGDAGDLRRHCPHYDVTVMYGLYSKQRGWAGVDLIKCEKQSHGTFEYVVSFTLKYYPYV